MACYSLYFLNNLNIIEAKELEEKNTVVGQALFHWKSHVLVSCR